MGVTYTFVDGTTALAGEVNQNFTDAIGSSAKQIALNPFGVLGNKASSFILPFSSVIWEMEDSRTEDAGATKEASGGATAGSAWLCKADTTKAFNSSGSGSVSFFTTDSGTTWTAPTTKPNAVNASNILASSYRLDGLIYLAGEPSSGTGLWYSTDDGDNFTQVGTPASGSFCGVGMHDATHGIAIQFQNGSIWYTTNGTTWVDSGHGLGNDAAKVDCADVYVYASGGSLTDFKCLILHRRSDNSATTPSIGNVEAYDGTSNSHLIFYGESSAGAGTATNFVLLDNGTLCFAYANGDASTSTLQTANIVSTANPTATVIVGGATLASVPTFYVTPLGLCGYVGAADVFEEQYDCMNQYDTNKVLIFGKNRKLWQVDLSGVS